MPNVGLADFTHGSELDPINLLPVPSLCMLKEAIPLNSAATYNLPLAILSTLFAYYSVCLYDCPMTNQLFNIISRKRGNLL